VYHSAYDTFEHFTRFGDPGFAYSLTLARAAGRLVLRAADADVEPFQFGDLARTVAAQIEALKTLAATQREHAATVDRLIDQKAFALADDPTTRSGPPDREDVGPDLDFSPLDRALARLKASAQAYDLAAAVGADPGKSAQADIILQGVEQGLTDSRGLPGRPWYRHLLYAPGLLTGYGAKTLPGVREAIEGRRWSEATDYIGRTAAVLDTVSAKLDQATAALKN
jgi:N-acetylated-alpha-linked acidic dipeptidase